MLPVSWQPSDKLLTTDDESPLPRAFVVLKQPALSSATTPLTGKNFSPTPCCCG